MKNNELKVLIDECCNDIFDRLEPLANVKSRLYESLKTPVDYCPFEKYAVFCIECDRKGIKPLKHDDYLKL